MSGAKTADLVETPCGVRNRVGQGTVYSVVPGSLGNEQFGSHFPAQCYVWETPGVSQSYSLGSSSDAAFRCQ